MTTIATLAWFADPWTVAIVGLVALLLFGKRLPDVGRSLGRGISEFKKGLKDVGEEINRDDENEKPAPKLQAPRNTEPTKAAKPEPTAANAEQSHD